MTIARFFTKHSIEQLLSAYICGSVLIGALIFLYSQFHLINPTVIGATVVAMVVLTLANIKYIYASTKETLLFVNDYVIKHDRWRKPFIVTLIILLTWIALMTLTPARQADAMRYHLAQLKDITLNHGYIFRPYLCYHFPMYFGMLFLPIFMVAKGIGIKAAVFLNFLLAQVTLQKITQKINLKHNRLLLLLLYLTPIGFDLAHAAMLEWPLILYILATALMLLTYDENKHPKGFLSKDPQAQEPATSIAVWKNKNRLFCFYIGFASLGFACGIKYQAIVFIPWFCYLGYKMLKNEKHWYWILLLALVLLGATASPFYIRNLIELQNPLWPLAAHLFPSKNVALTQLAQNFFSGQTLTAHNLNSMWQNIKMLAFSPMIPATLWLLGALGLIFTKTTRLHIKAAVISFFIVWWLAQPVFLPRFSLYILPIVLIAAVQLLEHIQNKQIKWCLLGYYTVIVITLGYSIFIAVIYSPFYLRYPFTHDTQQYHQYTWYYSDYMWMNQHLPKNARVLVFAKAGQTYYLNRPYVRGDASQSASINWGGIHTLREFKQNMEKLGINYIFYNQGSIPLKIKKYIIELMKNKRLKVIYKNRSKLFFSRIRETHQEVNVYVLKLML